MFKYILDCTRPGQLHFGALFCCLGTAEFTSVWRGDADQEGLCPWLQARSRDLAFALRRKTVEQKKIYVPVDISPKRVPTETVIFASRRIISHIVLQCLNRVWLMQWM